MRIRAASAAVLAAVVLTTGCTGPEPAPSPDPPSSAPASQTPTPASPTPTVSTPPLGETYQIPAGAQPVEWGEPIATAMGKPLPAGTRATVRDREGWQVDLMGVYRLASDRVLVEVRLDAAQAKHDTLATWTEPDYSYQARSWMWQTEGYDALFSEFSDVKLTVADDDNTYLPVRTSTSFCLCTMANAHFRELGGFPVYVVMSAPADAATVTLTIDNVGGFEDVPVAAAPPERTVTPLGGGYQLRAQNAAAAVPGRLRVRFAVERAEAPDGVRTRSVDKLEGSSPWKVYADSRSQFRNLIALAGTGAHGGWPAADSKQGCSSCTDLKSPSKPGDAVDGEIELPDPGGDGLLLAPTAGWPLTMPQTGDGRGPADAGVVEYLTRFTAPGVVVTGGDLLDLDAAVLFATDSAKLTTKANAVLNKAAQTLREQDGRSLRVVGHTDSTGSASHNLELSKRRAAAVRDGLASRLGDGWTFTVEGRGESDLKVKEAGLSGADLKRARALNRRVEVSVE